MINSDFTCQSRWVIVGLGNPGQEYKHSRHNLGIEAISNYAKQQGGKFSKRRKLYAAAEIKSNEAELVLVKTRTFVNDSGIAVKRAMQAFQGTISHTLIVCDDINLPFGKIRLRKKGNAGGHNGLKSISKEILSNEYPRLRIGIGLKENTDPASFVLAKFKDSELSKLHSLFKQVNKLLNLLFLEGIDRTMNRFN